MSRGAAITLCRLCAPRLLPVWRCEKARTAEVLFGVAHARVMCFAPKTRRFPVLCGKVLLLLVTEGGIAV